MFQLMKITSHSDAKSFVQVVINSKSRDRSMATFLTNLTIFASCALALALLAAHCTGATQQQKQDGLKEPQLVLELGPVKFGVAYKESKLKDRLKLNKIVMNYYLSAGQGQLNKHLLKVVHRDDLIRCQNFLAQKPEMESLIDCYPLDEHVVPDNQIPTTSFSGDAATNYVKRTTLAAKTKLNFLPFIPSGEFRYEAQFYPFKSDFTERSILRVLKQLNMEQGLGFGPSALTSGYFVELRNSANGKQAQDSIPYQCTANLFISINQTRPIPAQEPGDNEPEVLNAYKHYFDEIRESGGFVSVQDASCTTPLVPVSTDSDFTLIYRKQFPYITCSHHIKTDPIQDIWNYTGTIEQTKGAVGSTSDEAYETKVNINSLSNSFKDLNFVLDQNFTNKNFSAGFEQMLLAHPLLSAFVWGGWSEDSLLKILLAYPVEALGALRTRPDGPNFMLIFNDKPEMPVVTFSLSIHRRIFYNLLSPQKLASQEEEQPEGELNINSLADLLRAIPPELRLQIESTVQQVVLRDEL